MLLPCEIMRPGDKSRNALRDGESGRPVILIDPHGRRRCIGECFDRSGAALQKVLQSDYAQSVVLTIPGIEDVWYTKTKDKLVFENGYVVTFGSGPADRGMLKQLRKRLSDQKAEQRM